MPSWPQVLLSLFAVGAAAIATGQVVVACGSSAPEAPGDAAVDGPDGGGSVDAGAGDQTGLVDAGIPDEDASVDAENEAEPRQDGGCTILTCSGQCLLDRCVFVVYMGGNSGAYGIAAQSGTVYWTIPGATQGAGDVLSRAVSGIGSPTFWATSQDTPEGIAVNATNVYWANASALEGSVVRELLSTGGVQPDAGTADGGDGGRRDAGVALHDINAGAEATPTGVVIDGSYVYWTVQGSLGGSTGSGFVIRAPLAGGMNTTLASGQYAPTSIAVDDTNVYWIDTGLEGLAGAGVLKVDKAGTGKPVVLAPVQSYAPVGIAVSGGTVYFGEDGGGLWSVPIDSDGGGQATMIRGAEIVGGVAADDTNVYWTVAGGNHVGSVLRVPVGGTVVTTLASGLDNPGAITLDDTSVYWVDTLSGGVMSLNPK